MEKQKIYSKAVHTYHLIEGAKQAKGLTVIIDVFRAFSLECYLYDMGAQIIRPVGSIENAFALKEKYANSILVGERHGKKCEGFDHGNSPCVFRPELVSGKTVIHTTSAGTQGVTNAVHADKIITGSLVNAKAVAEYIIKTQPDEVSLVCMGNEGIKPAAEDELCADYIRSVLNGEEFQDMEERIRELRYHGGEHFFDPENQEVFPKEDFYLCTKLNHFDFILKIEKDEDGLYSKRIVD